MQPHLRTVQHARPALLQNGDEVTVEAPAKMVSACTGNNLQLIICNRLSQYYVYTQQKDIRLLKILITLLDSFITAEQ